MLALNRYAGMTPRLFDRLMTRFGDLDSLLEAGAEELDAMEGVPARLAGKLHTAGAKIEAMQDEIDTLGKRAITVRTRFSPDYSSRLFELNDPPTLLYVRGQLPEQPTRTLALTGADSGTEDGIALTTTLARLFAAEGIELVAALEGTTAMAAHLGSRAGGGRSCAILEAGFDALQSEELFTLAADIAHQGAVVSEYAPQTGYSAAAIGQTNRIIAGLAQAVVVTELYTDSNRAHDLIEFCGQIGKLAFLVFNPERGTLADERSLARAIDNGVIPLAMPQAVPDIIRSLV